MKTFITSTLVCLGVLTSPTPMAAFPYAPIDDNGNRSFVKQIVPKLLGRKPKGTLEVILLADIANLHGREALVRALMEQPGFKAHWTANIIDHLEMQRMGGARGQPETCFGKPPEAPGIGAEALGGAGSPGFLAQFVRDNDITEDFPESFNMYELIDSAISLGDLYPAYRAYLFPLTYKRNQPNSMSSAADIRAMIGSHFNRVYLNRDMDCIGCHRGTYSTTGVWSRTHPLYQSLDLAMFDHQQLGEYKPDIEGPYAASCAGCHGANGTGIGDAPGILDASVSKIKTALANVQDMQALASVYKDDNGEWLEGELAEIAESLADPGSFGLTELGGTAEKHYAVFRRDLFPIDADDTDENEAGPEYGWAPWGMDKTCGTIAHSFTPINDGPAAAFFAGAELGPDASVLDVDASLQQGYAQLALMVDTMAAMDSDGADGPTTLSGDLALAYMLAAKITENIWEQLMGYPLTIANYFARNNAQRSLHQHLTEEVFIKHGWSLKETIVAVLTSAYFNRQAPVSSFADTTHALPAVFDPFHTVTASCLSGGRNDGGGLTHADALLSNHSDRGALPLYPNYHLLCTFNSQGDVVHRYAPRELISAAGAALDWPDAKLWFGGEDDNTAYPSARLSLGIGQYATEIDPGFKEVSLQSLLLWDEAYGVGATPANAGGEDWLARFRDQIDVFNADHPTAPLTLGDVVLSLKDWLIQEPGFGGYEAERDPDPRDPEPFDGSTLAADIPTVPPYSFPQYKADLEGPGEATLVGELFGMQIDDPVTTDSVDEDKLRQLVGVYLRSPQFKMAGLVRNDAFEAPRLRVCNDNRCTYKAMCESLAPALSAAGHATVCASDSVHKPVAQAFQVKVGEEEPEGGGFVGLIDGFLKMWSTK